MEPSQTNPRGAAAMAEAMAQAVRFSSRSTQLFPQTARGVVGRNDPCPCKSGRKFKNCCLARRNGTYQRDPKKLPVPVALENATVAETSTASPASKNATAMAMLRAKVSERIVWAYLETGHFITEANIALHPAANVTAWHAALLQYDKATPAERKIMLAPAVADDA